jgi:hypothetical protein
VLMYVSGAPEEADTSATVDPDPSSLPAGAEAGVRTGWASPDAVGATISMLNGELLLAGDAPAPTTEATPSVVKVPALTSVAIGACLAVTVVFGIAPGPLLDFAQHATLLFLGH